LSAQIHPQKTKKLDSYEKAYQELQAILQAMQEDQISIDQLAEKTGRAAELIAFCQQKLRETEDQISHFFEED